MHSYALWTNFLVFVVFISTFRSLFSPSFCHVFFVLNNLRIRLRNLKFSNNFVKILHFVLYYHKEGTLGQIVIVGRSRFYYERVNPVQSCLHFNNTLGWDMNTIFPLTMDKMLRITELFNLGIAFGSEGKQIMEGTNTTGLCLLKTCYMKSGKSTKFDYDTRKNALFFHT